MELDGSEIGGYLAMSMIHVSGSGCGWLWSYWGHRKVRIVDQEEEEVCNMLYDLSA